MVQMNVQPIPTVPDRINEVRALTAEIVNREILPHENMLWADARAGATLTEDDRAEARRLRARVRDKVRQAGLWA
ncbi:MAG TPA: hypothetical protein VFZ77_17490, partial [Acidimicrobiales bacterium]